MNVFGIDVIIFYSEYNSKCYVRVCRKAVNLYWINDDNVIKAVNKISTASN